MGSSEQRSQRKNYFAFDILLALVISISFMACYQLIEPKIATTEEIKEPEPILKFGFDVDSYHLESFRLRPNDFLGEILHNNGIGHQKIYELEKKAKDIFSVRRIRAGKDLTIVRRDSCGPAECFVYEPDPFQYVLYDLRDSINVEVVEKEFETTVETASGVVQTSLWNAMIDRGLPAALIDKMEDALANVSFYHAEVGDEFKLIYEQKQIDGETVSVGNLLGAHYKNQKDNYAIYFENDAYKGYYDLEGRPTKRPFLKTPVRASRISSRYNPNRLHPVLKRRKAHLGTDYAAPRGTPIRAVGDGVVIAASFTKNNGNYVKLKHDGTYQTQYLHMHKIARGIRRGVQVSQGETIGYVGSTGLATGPHVCFRFWKNGRQVDHLRLNFPPPAPMKEADFPQFEMQRDTMMSELQTIEINRMDADIISTNRVDNTTLAII